MTTRERLHELVDQLDDAGAERLLATANTLVSEPRTSTAGLPAFVGAFASGHTDISERAEEIRLSRHECGSSWGSFVG
ncbi:MAG: hypothetical protein ACRDTD_23960 [Pseudonocardiaceae bacterium]